MAKQNNRGWQVDSLLTIGHLEAALSHLDEFVVARDYSDLVKQIYVARKDVETDLLRECDDPNFWCVLKHLATAYVMSAEVCHARGYDMMATLTMNRVGDCLAGAAEQALGLDKTACLRCMADKLSEAE